jgi:hypothetical protein
MQKAVQFLQLINNKIVKRFNLVLSILAVGLASASLSAFIILLFKFEKDFDSKKFTSLYNALNVSGVVFLSLALVTMLVYFIFSLLGVILLKENREIEREESSNFQLKTSNFSLWGFITGGISFVIALTIIEEVKISKILGEAGPGLTKNTLIKILSKGYGFNDVFPMRDFLISYSVIAIVLSIIYVVVLKSISLYKNKQELS